MAIVVNRSNGNLTSGSSEALDLTGDDNGIIYGGLALDTGSIGTFNGATIGSDSFTTDITHDVETVFGTQTFITASGVVAGPTVSGSQTFTQTTSGSAFPGVSYHMLDVSGIHQTTPFKESPAPSTYNNAVPTDITYNIDNGGLALMIVSTNIGATPATIPGWTTFGTEKAISVMSSVRLYYRIATADETGSTVNPMNGATGRGLARLWVYNPAEAPPPDTTDPILTTPTYTVPTSVGFIPKVTTDEDNGTVYCVVVPDGDSPSVAQVKAGQQSSGAAALYAENIDVFASGEVSFDTVVDLSPGTDYEIFFVHTDVATNDSAAVSVGATTNTFGLTSLIENYTTTTGILTSPHPAVNSSGAGFDEETNRIGMIRNNAAELHEYDPDDLQTIIRTITCNGNFGDMECITYMGKGEIAIGAENGGAYYVYIYDLPAGTSDITINAKQLLTLDDAGTDNNSGIEGLTYDKILKVFWAVGEGFQDNTDRKIYRFARPTNTTTDYTYSDPEFTVEENPFDPEVEFASYGATGATFDLSGLSMDMTTGHLLILSDVANTLLQVNIDDTANPVVVSELTGLGHFQPEGVEVIDNGRLLIMGETREYQIRTADLSSSVEILGVTEADSAINVTMLGEYELSILQAFESDISNILTSVSSTNLSFGQAQSTETATVLSIVTAITNTLGIPEETDTVTPMVVSQQLAASIQQAVESALANSMTLSSVLINNLDQVSESNAAQIISLSSELTEAVQQVLEIDSSDAMIHIGQASELLSLASELDTANSVSINTGNAASVAQAIETNLSQAVTVASNLSTVFGQVTESDLAQVFSSIAANIQNVDQATEIDLAQSIDRAVGIVLNSASETDTATAISVIQSIIGVLAQANETDTSNAIDLLVAGSTLINPAESTETAGNKIVSSALNLGILSALETDSATAVLSSLSNNIPLLQASETDLAQVLDLVTAGAALINTIESIDSAQQVLIRQNKLLQAASETDQAITFDILEGLRVAINNASETDSAISIQDVTGAIMAQFSPATEVGLAQLIEAVAAIQIELVLIQNIEINYEEEILDINFQEDVFEIIVED